MAILCLLVLGLLLFVAAIVPRRSHLSEFELTRRSKNDDAAAQLALRREILRSDILSLQRVIAALLFVILVALLVATFGLLIGIIIAVIIALEYGTAARLPFITKKALAVYDTHEKKLLDSIERWPTVFKLIRGADIETPPYQLHSREEFEHLVSTSSAVLSASEKKLILHGIQFDTRRVKEIMTPRSVIEGVEKSELLGPLVLDDLHKTGHSRFPVIDKDIDHVVGMLYIQDLFVLHDKKSTTAEKIMEPRVFYIHEEQSLQHALTAFVRTHHHLFVVVNEFRETVGLLSLEDVIEALLGYKIVDEFDAHDDLRKVAERNPRGINKPVGKEDV